MKHTIIVLFCVLSINLFAQKKDSLPQTNEWDQNGYYVPWGFNFLTANIDNTSKEDFSHYFGMYWGYHFRYKICNFYKAGFEIIPFQLEWIRIKQRNSKQFPTAVHHDKERYLINTVSLNVFNRFRFTKTYNPNIPGLHLDIGGGLHYPLGLKHTTINDVNGNKIKVHTSKINRDPYAAVFGRIGYGPFAIKVNYRFNDIFFKNSSYPNPPRLTAGIEIMFGGMDQYSYGRVPVNPPVKRREITTMKF